MKKIFISLAAICLVSCSFSAHAQVGIGTNTPSSKAVLELKSPNNNQGFLAPRLSTAQRNAISGLSDSDNGLLVYDTDEQKFYYWHSSQWETLRNGVDNVQDLQLTGSILKITNNPLATPINLSAFTGTNTDDQSLSYNATSGLLSLTTLSTPSTVTITTPDNAITSAKIVDGTIATVDLANTSVTDQKISNVAPGKITQSGATAGQVLKWNGTTWAPAADAGLTSFTEADPLVKAINGIVKSNGTTISAATATDFPILNQNTTGSSGSAAILTTGRTIGMTGDVTWTSAIFNGSANVTGTSTIGTGAVTSAKILDGTIVAADLNSMSALSGQVLKFNGTSWAPASDGGLITEADPLVKAINGIVKSNGTTISAATAADFPILNQNTTGSAGSAAILTTGRTIGMTGDVTWTSATFNGNANVTGTSTIGTGVVTSAKIADGTIVAADLNSMSAVSGQVLKFNGTAWAPAADNGGGATPGLSEVLNAGNSAGGQEAHEFKAVTVNWDVKSNPYGALSVEGSQFVGITEVSLVSTYNVKPTDYLIIADGTPGAKPINVTLPSAAANKGRILIVRSISTSVDSYIAVRAADAIDGFTVYPEQLYYSQGIAYSITVVSTGKTWLTINRAVSAAGK